ncbi:MAG TPA: tRNA uracil 4-sulfurtransferase ThiI [Candidatus Margulisiibacteriota bacterium]|nr:tRNA uracil 4-sulfurtransferase ThiI [Candidatus Margulisiibacteriota bacterium]
MNRIVVHYHEVALKRGNRRAFVEQLMTNIGATLRGTGVKRVRSAPGRIVIHIKPDADWTAISRRLRYIFGIANYSLAWRTRRRIEDITATALAAIDGRQFTSFAVRTRRADKGFPLPSPEISRIVGRAIQDHAHAAVNLNHPELAVNVEVLPREAFVGLERLPGPGGLPVGTGGTVLSLISGGIDSPVAAYRMMRRGCRAEFVHFHGAPYQDRTSRDKVVELVRLLTRYQLNSRLHLVAFGEIQRQIVATVRRPFRVVLYRRMMMRIAEALAGRVEARALVTGESLGQVASQTLANMAVIQEATSLPLLRPLVGMDKAEISAQAEQIGTYEISIQPDQDCCQLFVPRHPAIRMTIEEAHDAERQLDIPAMVSHALDGASAEGFSFPEIQSPSPASAEGHEPLRTS